jgi:hypothetical protein
MAAAGRTARCGGVQSHNSSQLVEVCDRVNMIQDGQITLDKRSDETSGDELTEMVVAEYRPRPAGAPPRGGVLGAGVPSRIQALVVAGPGHHRGWRRVPVRASLRNCPAGGRPIRPESLR